MLNPILSNFRIDFDDNFFPIELTQKYDDFLFYKKSPFKSIKTHFYESIQQLNIPGINLSLMTVNSLMNLGKNPDLTNFPQTTVNKIFPGTAPLNEIISGTSVSITFRNSIINWMYCYEVLYSYYKRTRNIKDFQITLTLSDSAEIPMIRWKFSKCFTSELPALEFAYNQSFSESKTFDATFTFNEMDVDFIIPSFDLNKVNF